MAGVHEQAIIAAAGKATQGGSVVAISSGFAGWLAENHEVLASIGIMAGIAVGVTGLAVQVYFRCKRDSREQLLHDQRMKGG